METPPDTNARSVLPSLGQLARPENDVCVATLGAGPGAQSDGESVPCGPPQITCRDRRVALGKHPTVHRLLILVPELMLTNTLSFHVLFWTGVCCRSRRGPDHLLTCSRRAC